jgi:hypothetical protein
MTTHQPCNPLHHELSKPEEIVRHTIDLAVAVHGMKRGLYRAAEMLGVSESWLANFRFGRASRVSAEAYLRALDARSKLARERLTMLRAELNDLEKIAGEQMNAVANGVAGAVAGEPLSVDRRHSVQGR